MTNVKRVAVVAMLMLLAQLGFLSGFAVADTALPEVGVKPLQSPPAPPNPGVEVRGLGESARAEAGASDAAASRNVCVKEGEICNPLNDRCCDGLYCPGGILNRCFRKP